MATKLTLALTLLVFWLLLSGHYSPLLIGFGIASCILVVALKGRLETVDREVFTLDLLGYGAFLPWLIKEIVLSNVDVAKRILFPGRFPISPQYFIVYSPAHTDLGRVLYANSITLTPGTVSVSLDDNRIAVHALSHESADGLRRGEMGRRIAELEAKNR
ncbi:MAG: Na+/H+ antiporter subunit E [Candidatus Competibacterales bacterium]